MKKFYAVAVAALLGFGGAVGIATSAEAHTPSVTADCSGLTVNLSNYAAEKASTPETTTTSYVKWTFNPKGEPQNGSTPLTDASNWTKTHDTNIHSAEADVVLHNGHGNGSYFYWQSIVTTTPGTPGESNTVSITIDGTSVVDTTFGTTYNYTSPAPDQTLSHTYTVTVVAWDDSQYNVNFSKTVDACQVVVPPTPSISSTVTGQAVCNADSSTYDITWTGSVTTENAGSYVAQRVKYTGSTPPALVQDGVTPGSVYSYVTHVAGTSTGASADFHIHATQAAAGVDPLDTDAHGSVTLAGDCIPAVIIPVKPEPVVVTTPTTQTNCDAKTVTTTTVTTTTDWVYEQDSNTWVADEPSSTTSSETRAATETECPTAVVTPPVVKTPVKVVAKKVVVPEKTAASTTALADTGSNPAELAFTLVAIVALGGGLVLVSALRRKKETK